LQQAYSNTALLWIGGDHNSQTPPSVWDKELLVAAVIAQEVGTVVAGIFAIPNAPIIFSSDPLQKPRTEDSLLAFAWAHFIADPSNPEWLPRLPMTKASVRAMDAITAFWQQSSGSVLTSWMVAGASKRGWTTWTVAACDPRVIAIIPMVLDELNFVRNIKHHNRAYGGWSFALKDYYLANFTRELDNPNTQAMMNIIDPIVYTPILTMPKLILSTAGDEFLMPDNGQHTLCCAVN
jgi:PhoPQ-activated pathogenicity-related protein